MAGWTCPDNDLAEWNGTIEARKVLKAPLGLFNKIKFNTNEAWPGVIINEAYIYHSELGGLIMYGAGTTYDLEIANKNGEDVLAIPTGTHDVYLVIDNSLGTEQGLTIKPPKTTDTSSDPRLRLYRSSGISADLVYDIGNGDLIMRNNYATAAGDIIFKVQGTKEALRITGDGKIGIGLASPSTILDIQGQEIKIGGNIGNYIVRTDNNNKGGFVTIPHYDNDEENVLGFYITSLATSNNLNLGGGASGFNALTNITFYTGATSTTKTGTEKMRIDKDGNVGIGTATPEQLLQVSTSGAITAYGGFAIKVSNAKVVSGGMVVFASRNVNNYVEPCGLSDGTLGQDQPIGVVYHTTPSTAISGSVWIVVSGRARVLSDGNVVRGDFIRTSDTVSGSILASSVPTVPADASHWREVGHALESRTGAGLFDAVVHFN